MITGLTAKEAADLVKTHRCACNGILVDCWGGSFGVKGPVVRCLNDLRHSTYQAKNADIRQIGDKEYNVTTQREIVKADERMDMAPSRAEAGLSVQQLQHTATQLALVAQFVSEQLREGEDFGKVPGVQRPFLWKPGAENLASLFGCRAVFEQTERHINPADGFVIFQHRCQWISRNTGEIVLEGMGSCNSYEIKYRYREMKRTCPKCKAATIRKGNEQYGGGWYCATRDGGCGANFRGDDALEIDAQRVGREQNPDLLDGINTYMKMSMKRAEVDCAMRAPGVARYFAVDHSEDVRTAAEEEEEVSSGQRPRQTQAQAPRQSPARSGRIEPTGPTHCSLHKDIRMAVSNDKPPRRFHKLPDDTPCYGQPAPAPASGTQESPQPPNGSPQGENNPDLPPSQGQDEAELRAAVEAAKLAWDKFEFTVLQMRWGIWLQKKHTVAEARARLESYMRTPQAS